MTRTLVALEDRMSPGEELALDADARVVYVPSGVVEVLRDGRATTLHENQAWQGAGACTLRARADATVWRWELRPPAPAAGAERAAASVKLARAIELPAAECLMRCDRVDFPPGGVAYTHTHQGPGIRVLLRGTFRVRAGGQTHELAPGDAWFESGPEPVYAEASATEPTSFVRVMVLPASLLGKSSIRYVREEDQKKPKAQTYTVFVDALLPPNS
jgi:quercetin dioxygenase-like cupin family protein